MTVAAQILIARKAADPTALTARDAIRTLLGYGDRLADLFRRDLLELHLGGIASHLPASNGAWESVAIAIESYLESTVSFWNPNRERAWVRIGADDARSWEGGRGTMPRPFGEPALEQPGFDHLLVWSRDPGAPPSPPGTRCRRGCR